MNKKDTDKSHTKPIALDSITSEEFNSIMETGLSQAKANQSRPYTDVFADLRQKVYKCCYFTSSLSESRIFSL